MSHRRTPVVEQFVEVEQSSPICGVQPSPSAAAVRLIASATDRPKGKPLKRALSSLLSIGRPRLYSKLTGPPGHSYLRPSAAIDRRSPSQSSVKIRAMSTFITDDCINCGA